jgi:hypothetical protein
MKGKLPFLASDIRKRSSFKNTACENVNRQWTMHTLIYTYCNMPPFKNIILRFKKKVVTTNQIIWDIPVAVYILTYSSCTACKTVGTDNLHSIHCSVW